MKKLKEIFMEHGLRFICVVGFVGVITELSCIHNMKIEQSVECGVVVDREFESTQYAGQGSFGGVKIGTGYKSFNTYDYVRVGDTICKKQNTRKKQDKFLVKIK